MHSYAEQMHVTCPQCGHGSDADVWLIVDAGEHPDLVARIRDGRVHEMTCPRCGESLGQANAPLLVFRLDMEPHILFSPTPRATARQVGKQASRLVGLLQEQMGREWQDEWIAGSVPGLSQRMLVAALAGLQALLQELHELNKMADMPRRIALCEQGLAAVTRDDNTYLWAALQRELGSSLRQSPLGDRAANLEEALHHYELALEVYTRRAFAQDWAVTQTTLGIAYRNRIRGDKAANLEEAIRHFELALEIHTCQSCPDLWATICNNLGNAYWVRIRGERAQNLEDAIRCFGLAMEVHTRQAYPDRWAMIHHNLGNVYKDRILGERAQNLEGAIHHYNLALEIHTRQASPEQWAFIQIGLGDVYRDRILGERAQNLEDAIYHCEQALEVHTRHTFPEQWATIHNNLGNAYKDRVLGERAENLEDAIRHYNLALEIRTREAFPTDWAMTHNNLTTAYADRTLGERAQNVEDAIRHYDLALEVRTRHSFPVEWAATHTNLGNAYSRRIRGERAENLEEAICHYNLALEVRTRQSFPEQWAATHNNLATGYSDRILGKRAENLEEAIRHYNLVLQVYTRQAYPEQWATTQNGLGNVYRERLRGERAANQDEAIRYYQLALEIQTREAFPANWAMTHNNLGATYVDRTNGNRSENLEKAVHHYELALEVCTRQTSPEDWAMVHNNLANACWNRIRGERAANLEEAIHHSELALQVYTRQAFPEGWAITHNNLSNAYADRVCGEGAENLEESIHHCELVLEVYSRQTHPERWAMGQNNLGATYRDRIRGEHARNLEEAICHFGLALEIYQPYAFPDACRRTGRSLGNLHFGQRRWQEAATAYTQAVEGAEILYRAAILRSGKEAELAETADLYRRCAYALARCDRYWEAVEVLEQGRARLLAEALEQTRTDLERLSTLGHGDRLERYRAAAAVVQALATPTEGTGQAGDHPGQETGRLAEMERAQAALQAAIDGIRQVPGYEDFFLAPVFPKIRLAATPGTPLVYLLTTPAGSLALVVPPPSPVPAPPEPATGDAPIALWLDGFAEDRLDGLLVVRDGERVTGGYLFGQLGMSEGLAASLAGMLPLLGERLIGPLAARLRELGAGGLALVPAGRLALLPLHAATYAVDGHRRCLLDEFDVTYAPSARTLAASQGALAARRDYPLRLAGAGNPLPDLPAGEWARDELRRITPSLRGIVAGLSVQAEGTDASDGAGSGEDKTALTLLLERMARAVDILEALGDESPAEVLRRGYEIGTAARLFAPLSGATIESLQTLAARMPSLPNARAELASVLDLLPATAATAFYEWEATREALWDALPGATLAHFSCHGRFDPLNPLDSALELACDTRLTLADLLAAGPERLAHLRLAFLSACQTAITDFNRLPDEAVGLPAGFMQAGALEVIGTLWPVADLSTALLAVRFHELHLCGEDGLPPQPPARALRLAQCWLRDLTRQALGAYLRRHAEMAQPVAVEEGRLSWALVNKGLPLARGKDGSERPFAHPYFWAPFVHYGAL